MIVNELKRFAREMLVNVAGSLLSGKVPGTSVFTKHFFVQREERRVVALHTRTADVTLTEVIAHGE